MTRANLVLGLPASGKSTYIAALGHILLSQDVETELRLELSNDESHMLTLQEPWLRYELLKHTPTGAENWVTFHLESNTCSYKSSLELPDFSGESLKNAIATGIYPSELAAALGESQGIFLFTNAAGKQDDILLNDLYGMFPVQEPEGAFEQNTISVDVKSQSGKGASSGDIQRTWDSQGKTFEPTEMPEEPKLVQLLQTIYDLSKKKRKLVVMISAWDIVNSINIETKPVDWLQANKPMLWQFLNHNAALWETRVYGVSAQGGRIPEDTEVLKKVFKASQRVKLVGYDAKIHDLTAPLAWLAQE